MQIFERVISHTQSREQCVSKNKTFDLIRSSERDEHPITPCNYTVSQRSNDREPGDEASLWHLGGQGEVDQATPGHTTLTQVSATVCMHNN